MSDVKKLKDSWSREEVESLCRNAYKAGIAFTGPDYYSTTTVLYENECKWIEQNL